MIRVNFYFLNLFLNILLFYWRFFYTFLGRHWIFLKTDSQIILAIRILKIEFALLLNKYSPQKRLKWIFKKIFTIYTTFNV